MRQFLILCILLAALTSCEGPQIWRPEPIIQRDYDSDSFTDVTLHQAARLAHKHRWYLEDAWVYYNAAGIVNKIRLQYRTQNILELQQARALLVDVVEEYMEFLNANPDTSGHLVEGFSVDNLLIYVDFQSYWGLYGDPQYIGWMVLQDGMVYYYDFDVKNIYVDYWYSRIETYNKSREIVRLERISEMDYQDSLPPPPKSKFGNLVQ
ncbi:MAG: hypothetical protein HWD61_10400 [Parachlamydiaceae bacterium]|nr:MAG: hypothetical protein HWD61_10400 [Parachlamydiaceae bacterium]